jgi:hypothetical protein
MVAYVACEPYFDIATGKLANDVPMDVNDNNAFDKLERLLSEDRTMLFWFCPS